MRILNIPRKLLQVLPTRGTPLYYSIKAYTNWKSSGNYKRRPDPFKIVWVDPERIVYNSGERFSYIGNRSMYHDCGKVVDGDWDLSDSSFKDRTIYESNRPKDTIFRSLEMRFQDGYKWEDTPIVQQFLERVQRQETAGHDCRTQQDVMERFRKLDLLYKEIKENGYKSKQEIFRKDYKDPLRKIPKRNPALFQFLHDEVVVNIGRSGDLLFVGGHHRLSMALIAGIDRIPVRIFIRHHKWQQQIDKLSEEKRVDENPHPDLADMT